MRLTCSKRALSNNSRRATVTEAEQQTAICDGDQIPLEEAGGMLCKAFGNSHVSRERLDKAIREGVVRLWCDVNRVSPEYFAGELRVALAADERFTVAPTSPIGWARTDYMWTVSRKNIAELIKREKPVKDKYKKQSAGPVGHPKEYDYDQIRSVGKDLLAIGVDRRQAGFFERVRNDCEERRILTPSDNRGMTRIVGELYRQARTKK
jgi:hypothetical protein